MELMGEEFPHVRKRVADKVLRDNKNNKMGGGALLKFSELSISVSKKNIF